jgi:hypothetical protein
MLPVPSRLHVADILVGNGIGTDIHWALDSVSKPSYANLVIFRGVFLTSRPESAHDVRGARKWLGGQRHELCHFKMMLLLKKRIATSLGMGGLRGFYAHPCRC